MAPTEMTVFEKDPSAGLNAAVAAELRAERSAQKMTIDILAARSGIPKRTLLRLLNAERGVTLASLFAIASALTVDVVVIVQRAEERLARDEEGAVGAGSVTALPTSRRVGPAMATVGDAPGWGEDVVADDSVPYAAHTVEMSAADEAEMMEESP
ncbi:helix-turn-helix domain-containing protein [Actinomyces howellii]|nr:helix-turn-helix transcriptional regulator [Actinomyces howellii]